MENMRHIINALPLVADALGRKYGVKVLIGGDKAYTNGKDIHLPSLPLAADDTILKLSRGYIDHESAHLRLTDFDALHVAKLSVMEKYVWNIIEDYRVERKLGELYPGCHDNFNWLIRHLFLGKTEPEEEGKVENASMIFSWLLLSLRALAVPELASEKDKLGKMIEKSYPSLLAELDPFVAAIPASCETTHDAIEIARKIVSFLERYVLDNKNQEAKQKNKENGESEAKSRANDAHAENPQSNSAQNSDEEAGKNGQAVQNKPTLSQKKEYSNDTTSVTEADCDVIENSPINQLQHVLADPTTLQKLDIGKLAGEMLNTVKADNSQSSLSVAVPKPFNGGRLSPVEIADIRKDTTALRTRLSALLQSKVTVRNSIGRNGRICCQRIARLAAGDGRIFLKHGNREGINTVIHILLDVSGSMGNSNKITLACHACFAVAEALQKIQGVRLAITAFPNGSAGLDNSGQVQWGTVAQVLGYRQKMHDKFHIRPNGSTPMAEALWWVLQQMATLPEKRKILLLITDGEPDDLQLAQNALGCHKAVGHEIFGIGICTEAIRRLVNNENCRSIYNLLELTPALFEMLRTSLLQIGRRNQWS